jgi:hypothetical protein
MLRPSRLRPKREPREGQPFFFAFFFSFFIEVPFDMVRASWRMILPRLRRVATVGRRIVLGRPCPADRSEIPWTSLLAGGDEEADDRDHDDCADDPEKNSGWHKTGAIASHK